MSDISSRMPDISFKVQVNPDVVQKYNSEKVDRLANKHGLDKTELAGNGLDITEASLPLDTFKKLSGNTGVITKETLIKFDDGNETPAEKIAKEIKDVLPAGSSLQVIGPKSKSDTEMFIQSKYGDTEKQTFTMVGAKDGNNDHAIDVGSEIVENDMVKTTKDAVELGGKDLKADANEAMNFFLKKKGTNTSAITITNTKAPLLNAKLGELMDLGK